MKFTKLTLIALGMPLILLLAACGNAEESDSSADSASTEIVAEENHHENVIYTAKAMADYAHIANSVEELAADSDFIAEVRVTGISSYVYDGTDEIHTLVEPEIVQLYKGEYNDEQLDVYGGYMNYNTYVEQSFVGQYDTLDVGDLSAEELETAEIYYNLCNCHIPEIDDTLLFFGKISEDGSRIVVTNTYQGLFLCDGDTLVNSALIVEDESGWQEPLVGNILEQCSQTDMVTPLSEACDQEQVLSLSKAEFLEKLNAVL